MHLQSLELFGFKSFADKTIFNFHEGVTAIVGPNGCGKSNVLDATRWVLGEQSAKALRGSEMADVIFNGTDSRKPLGYAEVALTFTNCAQDLGVDWHDVRVSRRVYRDGNSEYFLNKNVCRLKDIQSLFADTGVGRSAYSIMEQGKLDQILSSRPEDRRAVFEEAAGITKYRTQKREAMRKLEATEANLLRIGDIIKEVKRQIGSLQRQAGKARRYQALLADLQVLDTHHSRRRLSTLESDLEHSQAESARLTETEHAAQSKIEASENDLSGQRSVLDEIDRRINDARGEAQRLQNEMASHRHRIEFNRQRAQEFVELIDRYGNDIGAAEAKQTQQANEIEEADALIEKTNRLLATKEAELDELAQRAARLRDERAEREAELTGIRDSITTMQSRISGWEDDLNGSSVRRETTVARLADLETAIGAAARQFAETAQQLTTARTAITAEETRLGELLNEARGAEKQLQEAEQTLAGAEKNLATLEREIVDKESRLEILRQLNEEGAGLAQGSQAVLRGLDDPETIRPALAGALVSQLDVSSEFVAAIEAALGRNLHAVVLRDAQLAARMISTLTSQKLGQAALALPELATTAPASENAPLPEGALGWAHEKVTAPEALRPFVRQLLGHVILAPDLESALAWRRAGAPQAAATLAGEFLSLEGTLFGGRSGAQSDSVLERKARIQQLAEEKASLEERRASLVETRESAAQQLQSLRERVEETRARHQAAHLEHSTATGKISLVEREQHETEQKLTGLRNEKSTLDQQVRVADEHLAALQQQVDDARENLRTEQARAAALQSQIENAHLEEEEATERLNEVRLAVATERQRQDLLMTQREPMAARAAELAEMIATRRTDIARYRDRLDQQDAESKAASAAIEAQTTEFSLAERRVTDIADERARHVAGVSTLEAELRRVRDSLNDLRDQRGKQEVRQAQLQMQIENLAEHVQRRYQVDLRAFETDSYAFAKTLQVQLKRAKASDSEAPASVDNEPAPIDEPQLEQIITELTRQLDNMGPVNLDAVQEYDELEERYKFLETQNSDLTAARRELLDVIARINETTQKLFGETFAQVRTNFREMFGELFGGGRADLSLQDENDPLNCGIEISAKPPGKQLQSVSLLSGGERTMTAVALLFAIYMVRPSPFCILDEMDAPLDESNINRFIRVLERFVQQSQFIIITHNKRTIAKADVLYGVTMEERGVSKLVGMKLTAATVAENGATAPVTESAKSTQAQFPLATPAPRSPRSRKLAATN